MSEPTGRFAGELYDALRPLAYDDEANGWALAHFCEGIGQMFEPLAQLVRDTEDSPGWSALLDLDRAPFLDWLAQFNGSSTEQVLVDADKRQVIRDAPGFRRGTPASIVAAAQLALTGQKRVTLVERDGGAYLLKVITYTSETPDPDAVLRAILTRPGPKPAGLVLTYLTQLGWVYSENTAYYVGDTYADMAAEFSDYEALRARIP